MRVIATAGHVDHGKSTLVRALTGTDPDRWAEERRRGLTLDLGFAWTALPGGVELCFVDVPGHQRFVPNMLAGVGPVPAVLFVVAADEGWRPQSAEHLAALDAFGVRHGLLAVTRSDLADPEPARREALDQLARTGLGAVPSVAVSGVTGAGMDDLRAALVALAARVPDRDRDADVRLWVDRSFTIAGAGTVVTGTLGAGTVRVGDELSLASTGGRVRVRGLQSLGRDGTEVAAVARIAVNLRGVEREAVRRGDALLSPAAWRPTEVFDAVAHVPADAPVPTHVVLHVGSAAAPARVRRLGGTCVRVTLDRELPLRHGDRALLRDPGRHHVVTGLTVLDADPPPLDRRGAARTRGADLDALVAALPSEGPLAATRQVLRRRTVARGSALRAAGLPVAGEPVGRDWYADPVRWKALAGELADAAAEWRRAHPLESGMPAEAARQRLGLPDAALVEALVPAAGLVAEGGRLHPSGPATPALPAALERAVQAVADDLAEAPFQAPDAARLAALGLGRREIAAAVRAGRLLAVTDTLVLLPDAPARAAEILATLPQPFTASEARQALATSRRVALPLLDLLDRTGLTERLPDDRRRLRRGAT
ncbi:MAG: selenocysteine-specific translation elongation factor [Mycobacteriales bacterium]